MKIKRDRVKGNVSLTQKVYLHKVLQKFYIGSNAKSVSSPLTPHFKFSADMSSKTVDEHEHISHVSYASVVGSLMYDIACTRSDLSKVVSMILRYIHDPRKGHWEVVRWILRYIRSTTDVGLVFE